MGNCGQCSATNNSQCVGNRPVCIVSTGNCGPCASDADCSGNTPACQPGGNCGQCSPGNKTQCTGATPVCNAPAATCTMCTLAGADGGGDNSGCVGNPQGPLCHGDMQGNPFCGCNTDSDCGARDSGRICDGASSKCVDGCSPAPNRNHCPMGRFCSSNDITGVRVGMCTTTCNFDPDCAGTTPAMPLCLLGGDGGANMCVACRTDADCTMPGKMVCDTGSHLCVQCTSMEKGACRPDGAGGACRSDGNCGCFNDGDCGAGRLCATGVCTSAPDLGVGAGDGGNGVGDGGNGGDGGNNGLGFAGGGLGCSVAAAARPSGSGLAILAALILGLAARRRRGSN